MLSISASYTLMQHWSKTTHTKIQKTKLQAKKLSQMDEETVKKGYLYAPFSQKHVSKSKSHSLIEAHDPKTSRSEKNSSPAILLFCF